MTVSVGLRFGAVCLMATTWYFGGTGAALAQQAPPPGPPATTPAAEADTPTALTIPAMGGPLSANPNPFKITTPPIGDVYISGAASGFLLTQTSPLRVPGLRDNATTVDLSNLQLSIQKNDGLFQFFIQPGAYSLPTVGVPYTATRTNVATDLFGPLPIAWGKIQPTDTFSIQGGKLPTLIGVEGMFTFQNMNVQRGLLWNQEPLVSRGVQANLTTGPVAWSASLNDGYFSGDYTWMSGSAVWTINPANSVAVTGGGSFSRNRQVGPATPVAQNNSQIIEAHYTYSDAPITIIPQIQYTHVDSDAGLGIVDSSTFGVALFGSYKFTDNISLAGRFEYIDSSGAGATGAGLLGYGTGSSAVSFTVTPTWQSGYYFIRGEGSVVQLSSSAAGARFGAGGNSKTQGRFMLETGVIF